MVGERKGERGIAEENSEGREGGGIREEDKKGLEES